MAKAKRVKKVTSNLPVSRVLSLATIVFFLILPYYLFGGRLFLGGDDTRFYFTFPRLFLNDLVLYSWNNISSLPYYIPNHYWLPLVSVLSVLDYFLKSKMILSYLSFSMVLIFGFVYFQKFIKELIGTDDFINYTGALIYILSPITVVGLSFFLAPIWLLALAPIISYYYLRYIKLGSVRDLIATVVWSIFLSFVYYSIPWILGFAIPIFCGVVFYIIFFGNPSILFKRTLIFIFFVCSSQLFWAVSFVASLVSGGATGLGQRITSLSLADSFRNTIISTANDNIIYPLFNLYHRKLIFDFGWHLEDVYLHFYDKLLPLGLVFILVLFLGIWSYKKVLSAEKSRLFMFIFAAFLVSLYFSTINIGFLKEIFILLGYLPGFGILRNFTDKFSLSYVFIYSTLIAFCLYIIKKSYAKFSPFILVGVVLVTLINFIPVKQIVVSPLWKTNDIYTTVNLPKEYIDFTKNVKQTVPNTTNIFSVPQNITSYSIITEENGKNAYIGTSPFKFFTGINDLTGSDSYPGTISNKITELITKRDYKNLLILLSNINAGYLIEMKNVPREVLSSYLFDKKYLAFQDEILVNSIAEKKLLSSPNGNYTLYKLKNSPKIITSQANIAYKKINPVKYLIDFKNLKGNKTLLFYETYHPGWNLYVRRKPVFNSSHSQLNPYGNKWVISSDWIEKHFDNSVYNVNKDGSIDITLTLYFFPQIYFYVGIVASIICLGMGFTVIFLNKNGIFKKNK